MPTPRPPAPRPLVVAALAVFGLVGCLGEPEAQSCAEDPTAPGCAPDGAGPEPDVEPPEGGLPDLTVARDRGPAPDEGPDATPDMGPADDLGLDGGPELDRGPDPDDAGPDMAPDMLAGECEPGTSQPCGTDEGACVSSERFCTAEGRWDEDCPGAIGPAEEICNGLDDDCDTQTDEGCDCVDGTTQPCGTAIGACMQGEQLCVDGRWSEGCDGGFDGSEEVCDGVDNDCDGQVDDVPAVIEARPCTVGVGACAAEGVFVCGAGEGPPVCGAVEGEPREERCNRVDDDCDGAADEGIAPSDQRLSHGSDVRDRIAMVPYIEFHTAVWIDDGVTWFGQFQGGGWEIEPVEFGNYDGGDTIANAVAIDALPDGDYRVVVAYDGLGSGVDVWRLDGGGGAVGSRYSVGVDYSEAVDVVAIGQDDFAVAFVVDDRADGTDEIGVEYVVPSAQIPPRPQRASRQDIGEPQLRYRRPSVAYNGGLIGVAFEATDPRAERGNIVLALVDPSGRNAVQRIGITRGGTAANPDLVWLPQHQRWMLAYDDLADGVRRVHVAVITGPGEVVSTVVLPAAAAAERPALIPRLQGRDPVPEVAVAWDRSDEIGFNIVQGYVAFDGRGWSAAPNTIARIFGEQGGTAGVVGGFASDGSGYAVGFTYDDTRSARAQFITLGNVCAERP